MLMIGFYEKEVMINELQIEINVIDTVEQHTISLQKQFNTTASETISIINNGGNMGEHTNLSGRHYHLMRRGMLE